MAFIEKSSEVETIAIVNEGQSIEGFYLGFKEIDDSYNEGKKNKIHRFQTPCGVIGVWGKTYLDKLLTPELLNTKCRVAFTGMIPPKKKGRRPAYGYKVQYDPSEKLPQAYNKPPEIEDSSFDVAEIESPSKTKASNNKR